MKRYLVRDDNLISVPDEISDKELSKISNYIGLPVKFVPNNTVTEFYTILTHYGYVSTVNSFYSLLK